MSTWPGCCCGEEPTFRVTVRGCNSMLLEGAVVTITMGGTDYTGTTDASGVVDLAIPATGSYSMSTSHPSGRFATQTGSGTRTSGLVTLDVLLLAATGYTCQDWESTGGTGNRDCVYPLANTLYLTDPIYGAVTLTFGGSNWGASKVVSYVACGPCPAGSITLSYGVGRVAGGDPSPVLQMSSRYGFSGCPQEGGPGIRTADATLAANDLDCPPAFLAPLTYVADGNFRTHCTGTHNFTLTE